MVLTNNSCNETLSPLVRLVDVKNIINKTDVPAGDYAANPYVGCTHGCKYCYACFMKRFTNHNEPWGSFLDVKIWPQINAQKYAHKKLIIGTVTDPYNPQEAQYKRTYTLLKELVGVPVSLTILTKSDLVLRDIDLLKSFANVRVGFSINTLDENFRGAMDNASSIAKRLNAMKVLHEQGIRTACFISPIFPGITDVPAIIDEVKEHCQFIWLENLNLSGNYKQVILNFIKENYPNLKDLYDQIYLKGDRTYWVELDRSLQKLACEYGLDYVVNEDDIVRPFEAPPVLVNFFYHEKIKKSASPA